MIKILYRPNTEMERPVIEFIENFRRSTGRKLETISLDTREGADMARLYDIAQYPAVLALSEEGQLLNNWQGLPLPVINDVSYYMSDFTKKL